MKKREMTCTITTLITGLALLALVPTLSCKKETDRFSFWRGDLYNFYYKLDMNDQPLHKVVGKPYMIYEYDPVTGDPLRVEFGLYEARNEYLPGCQMSAPEPFLSASTFAYARRLGITGSVDLLCNWEEVTSRGLRDFSIDKGRGDGGHAVFHFSYIPDATMTGEIINQTASWGGRISDSRAFVMSHEFNSGTSY
jgi:hypothetical protein